MDYLPWRAGPKAVRESFSCSKPEICRVGMGDLILIQLPPLLLPAFPPSPCPLIYYSGHSQAVEPCILPLTLRLFLP